MERKTAVSERMRHHTIGALLVVLLTLAGCAGQAAYYEKHDIEQLTVVFLDEQSLWRKWSAVTGKSPITITAASSPSQPSFVRVINGFYDFHTHTIYCPKGNFEVCGRQLHHAALGRFHAEH